MDLTIQSVNFDATEKLKAFIEKKVNKLERITEDIILAEVILKVVPDAVNNKDASIKINLRHKDAFAKKDADNFEEAIDLCIMALEKQILKSEEKNGR